MPEIVTPGGGKVDLTVSQEESESLFQIQSIFVNRFYVTQMAENTRLTFSEQAAVGGPVHQRVAITLSTTNLVLLRDLLNEMTKDLRQIDLSGAANG